MKPPLRRLPAACLALAAAAAAAESPPVAEPVAEPSAAARAYLEKALDAMQGQSIHRHRVDWPRLRREVLALAAGAQQPADTHEAIRAAIAALDDGHSFLLAPSGESGTDWVVSSRSTDLAARPWRGRLGYLLLPSFGGPDSWDPAAARAFAERIQRAVAEVDAAGACGWIVDLRFNSGGNMWPMLAGVGPILGEGEVGAFAGAGDERVPWSYVDGVAGTPNNRAVELADPLRLAAPDPPVAVLTSRYTTSSGEAVATAFRGRPGARSFGTATGGASTANQTIWLGDGAMLFLTVARFADRAGNVYGGPLAPDQVVAGGADELGALPLADDPVVTAAADWLEGRPACLKSSDR